MKSCVTFRQTVRRTSTGSGALRTAANGSSGKASLPDFMVHVWERSHRNCTGEGSYRRWSCFLMLFLADALIASNMGNRGKTPGKRKLLIQWAKPRSRIL